MSRRAAGEATQPSTLGSEVQSAITQVLRWVSRGDVRRRLLGPAGAGLSANDVHLLRAVAATGPVRASELADAQGVDKSTLTPQVRRLEERGLVARQPDPADARAVLLSVTQLGQEVREGMNAAGAAVFDDLLRSWPEADRRALSALLGRFAEQLSSVSPSRDRKARRSVVPPDVAADAD